MIQVDATVARYFLRRDLLPNQKVTKEFNEGGLILTCQNVNENEVIPIVQYWLPHARILSPDGLQNKLEERLRGYLAK